ncbi:phosphoenolpyruvate--protein phosphotransferase [Paenibacillus chitinolyticus]|uniref:Phosphoenolpyruvate-protein phosphotransferase n=1 Tax=Paenibacillus chitinolyticus TaxID=79263 RepID=A0A410WTQ8_9BACL|nr:phosphoenolpyruvate--protein phosphotransferase [Paenibacillus chitinolyticus]MCY9593068.1 phosphoenolpyruvate--protein phosphotransferase [Paenibacillus chitinolyticus]MCY9599098.1 phosphoenolpyruvate--protein phosphotransferase [Paenibacillus chitinolyticus]QAV17657.1 phosphoenolpyruvate--protein phosphotransferase [Paenibacillus chitinolyticus]
MKGLHIQGIGVSEGIRIAQAFVYRAAHGNAGGASAEWKPIAADPAVVEAELAKLKEAKARCAGELERLTEKAKETVGEEQAGILAGQRKLLDDPAFYPKMEARVREKLEPAPQAVSEIVSQVASWFEGMTNDYMKERAADIRDIGSRLLACLSPGERAGLEGITGEVILVADDLTPSDTVQLDPAKVVGFITRTGGATSHTAILARSLGIAAIVGAGDAVDGIDDGDTLVVDGAAGLCIARPGEAEAEQYRLRMGQDLERRKSLEAYAARPAVTADGTRVELAANIGTAAEAGAAAAQGADGVGLYRTEFLFMNSPSMPGEEEQYRAYLEAAKLMEGRPVIIRTMDIGGDKELPYLQLPKEVNPFLGYRAIRIGLSRKELLLTQLRAVLRASAYSKVKVMFPMISGLQEWRQAKEILAEAQAELRQEGVPFDENMEVGIMVEIPSTAVMAGQFAREVDFFSIGTNDLVQYTLAVDRMNEHVAYLYDYFHPAVLQLIRTVIEASHSAGKWTGMCGGMAGDPLAAPLLLGLGLDEWSMEAGRLSPLKEVLAGLDRQECRELAERVLLLDTPQAVRQALEEFRESKSV